MSQEQKLEMTDSAEFASDSLTSLTKNLGTERDGMSSMRFDNRYLDPQTLIAMVENNWIAQKIVLTHPRECTKKWRVVNHKDAKLIYDEERRLKLKDKTRSSMEKANTFGGAGIVIGIRGQKMSEPLDFTKVKKGDLEYLSPLTQHELRVEEICRDVRGKDGIEYGAPLYYVLDNTHATLYGEYGSEGDPLHRVNGKPTQKNSVMRTSVNDRMIIHPSRVAVFKGAPRADDGSVGFIPRSTYGGLTDNAWGISRLQAPYDAIVRAESSAKGVASLMLEANIDVIGIPGLGRVIEEKEAALLKRFRIMAICKGINGMLVLDAEDEYNRKGASFANLDKIMERQLLECAAASNMPAIFFLGQAPGGLQATGESEERVHHDMVESIQTNDIDNALYNVNQCLVRSALGTYPEDLDFEWVSLRQQTEKEKTDVTKVRADSVKMMGDAGVPVEVIFQLLTNWDLLQDTGIDTVEKFKAAIEIDEPRPEPVLPGLEEA